MLTRQNAHKLENFDNKIKIPEGIISLGAELIDLGADTNTAASVEQFFDDLTEFDEKAEATAAGRITEALVNIGIPGGMNNKILYNNGDGIFIAMVVT